MAQRNRNKQGLGTPSDIVSFGRLALAALTTLSTSGCLIASPPDLEDPERTRPFVHLKRTDPLPGDILILPPPLTGPIRQVLNIHFQSEDLGEPVTAALHLDIGRPSYDLLVPGVDSPPSTFDEPRSIELIADLPSTLTGCHRLTAVLAHASSFNRLPVDGFVRPDEEAQQDSESVNWTVSVIGESSVPISSCVQAGAEGD